MEEVDPRVFGARRSQQIGGFVHMRRAADGRSLATNDRMRCWGHAGRAARNSRSQGCRPRGGPGTLAFDRDPTARGRCCGRVRPPFRTRCALRRAGSGSGAVCRALHGHANCWRSARLPPTAVARRGCRPVAGTDSIRRRCSMPVWWLRQSSRRPIAGRSPTLARTHATLLAAWPGRMAETTGPTRAWPGRSHRDRRPSSARAGDRLPRSVGRSSV